MKLLPAVILALTLSSAAASAQSPTPQQLSNLRLHDGFTLTYQVSVRDVRTPALREKDVAEMRVENAKEAIRQHFGKGMTDELEAQAVAQGLHRPDEHFQITLSARDGKLLFLSTRSGTSLKDGSGQAVVLDGEKEYEADDPKSAMINNDAWRNAPVYRDENVDRLAFYPLPGVGLPGVDLVQQPIRAGATPDSHAHFRGLVPLLNLVGADPVYRIGEIDTVPVGGHLRVLSLMVGAPAAPLEAWKMTAFQLFQEHWISTQMQMTEYEMKDADDEESLTANLPTSVSTYDLVKASPTALEASAFEIGAYLIKGASVFDDSVGSSSIFTYDPQLGTLKEQAAAQKKESQKDLKIP